MLYQNLYLKSYCYSQHELPFIIANLDEGFPYITALILYEYNYTHTGLKKSYEIEKVLDQIPQNLKEKLIYKKINLSKYNEYAYTDKNKIHNINEPIQRSWMFNDEEFNLKDDDIIIDHDIDEIIYSNSYISLIKEMKLKNRPLSIKLNQFFFRHNYLWTDCNFSSPTIYKYSMVKNIQKKIKGLKILNQRDLSHKTDKIYGCHMSWIMPVDYMINKLESYSHPEYRKYSNKDLLEKAIKDKIYIFDTNRKFNIKELPITNNKIPKILQLESIF